MRPTAPAAMQLAQRLRYLRTQQWPDVSSTKLPPPRRLLASARFFATPRSIRVEPTPLPLEELTEDELAACEKLAAELLTLRSSAIGGVEWNGITGRLPGMARLRVRQVVDPELLSGSPLVAEVDGKEMEFSPKRDTEHTVLVEDVGLLAQVSNPLNSSRTLTICNGIYSRGVYGAVRSLTDAQFRDTNERYISAHFRHSDSFVILMSDRVIGNQPVTPDFSGYGGVLSQWPQGTAA